MTHIATDKDGNQLFIKNNDVILDLVNKGRKNIGSVRIVDGQLNYYKQETERNTFLKFDAWSINFELYKIITGSINIRSETTIYRITKEVADKVKLFLHFKEANVELKVYIPKKHFKQEQFIH